MEVSAVKNLLTSIKRQRTERQDVELKSCHGGFPKRIYDTLSSFSNQDQGGVIIFGVTDKPEFAIVGVYDPEDTQRKIMEMCNQMVPPVRALTTICEIEGVIVVAAEIPSVERFQRPVYYAGAGRLRGSYVRVGDADEPMSEYEIYTYEAFRRRVRDDLRTVNGAQIATFNQDLLKQYLKEVKRHRKNLAENVSDTTILELMGITKDGIPTLAGTLTFSYYPQTFFPELCITAVVIPGTSMGDTGQAGERFLDNKKITGSIGDMLQETLDFIEQNSRHKTIITPEGKRCDRAEYPLAAVREAVLNALIHRDYSIYKESTPISVEMYQDRLEIKSSGGIYGNYPISALGKGRPDTRNTVLSNILEILHITENRYSGIPTIYKELYKAGLPEPEFRVQHDDFIVTFYNDFATTLSSNTHGSTRQELLTYCTKPRTRQEITAFLGKSRYYAMTRFVQPLVQEGILALTLPDKPQSSQQQFYTVR